MNELWYQNTTIYCLDIERFQDSNEDGVGDFQGLASRIDYLAALGVDCLWLLPHYETPNHDNGYDISDYFRVDSRLGDLGDFVDFMRQAKSRGIRVLLDLVVNHTSIEHPWFQAARRDPESPFRDFYIWSDEPTDDAPPRIVFNASDHEPWDYDEQAGQYYLHRFYRHEPDLNTANPELQREIRKIVDVWLKLGASGFRIDAAPYVGRKAAPAFRGDPHGFLKELREFLVARSGDGALMAEADVDPKKLDAYFGGGNEMQLLLNFSLANYLFLALARESSEPLRRILELLPRPPRMGQWANFLRNHDELDIEQLSLTEREEVYAAFAPKENMRIYQRGIRRRLAPMLGGDPARIRMSYSLLFSLPGTPVILYGDEIGMGDDLSQQERDAVRSPMQWSDDPGAGFSSAPSKQLALPVIDRGAFSYKKINVGDQRVDPDSLLNWFRRLIALRKEADEIAHWAWELVDSGDDRFMLMRYDHGHRCLLTAHNLCSKAIRAEIPAVPSSRAGIELFADRHYTRIDPQRPSIELEPYGYRWIRFMRSA